MHSGSNEENNEGMRRVGGSFEDIGRNRLKLGGGKIMVNELLKNELVIDGVVSVRLLKRPSGKVMLKVSPLPETIQLIKEINNGNGEKRSPWPEEHEQNSL